MISTFCPLKTDNVKSYDFSYGVDLQYFKSIAEMDIAAWQLATHPTNVFLQYPYLAVLERVPPKGMSFGYVILYADKAPIGVAYFQNQEFDVATSLKGYMEKGKLPNVNERIISRLNFSSLISGNMLVTGEHGFYFKPEVSAEHRATLMLETIEFVTEQFRNEGRGASLCFVKDFEAHQEQFAAQQRGEYEFHPNMILPIRANWNTFEDYLNDMSNKYRTRAKRAFKKLDNIKCQPFDLTLINQYLDEIYALYLRVANSVGFNAVLLSKGYFYEMKKTFGEDFELWGAFDGDKLIGFYTTLLNYEELETGFIGFDDAYNPTHQLYLNFLFNMVRQGIEKQVHRVVFARTAMEIKSSIGAEPHQMHTYLKHHSKPINMMLPHLVKWLSPPVVWEQRKPFKEN